MTVKLLIAAKDLKNFEKGDLVAIVPGGGDPGSGEGLPWYIQVTISDATDAQIHHYRNTWKIDFSHTLVSENELGWRYRIEVDPVYISLTDVGKSEMKTIMQSHCAPTNPDSYWYGCSIFSFSVNEMVVDIPKDGPYQTANGLSDVDYLKLLKSDFTDRFRTRFKIRRYYFDSADVDAAIAAGGKVTITKAQALAKMNDRLEE